jgi:hypothetical protein
MVPCVCEANHNHQKSQMRENSLANGHGEASFVLCLEDQPHKVKMIRDQNGNVGRPRARRQIAPQQISDGAADSEYEDIHDVRLET